MGSEERALLDLSLSPVPIPRIRARLHLVHLRVAPAQRHQFLVGATLKMRPWSKMWIRSAFRTVEKR